MVNPSKDQSALNLQLIEELAITKKELLFQKNENAKRIAELVVANEYKALNLAAFSKSVLLESAVDGIHVMDLQGNLLQSSPSFAAMLGYTPFEIQGLNVRDWDAQFSPSQINETFVELLKNPQIFETQNRRKDGTIIDVQIHAKMISIDGKDCIYCSGRDITKAKLSQEALRSNEEKLRGLFELSPIGIARTDMSGRFKEFNEAFRAITGYTNEELLSLDFQTITPKKYAVADELQIKADLPPKSRGF